MANDAIEQHSEEEPDCQFLPDTPLDTTGDVRFGHRDIAGRLKKIIIDCPTPYTIGLFGQWGSGKTTISSILFDELNQERTVPCAVFDVWKHEGDALKRTFLKELVTQFKAARFLPKSYELNERLIVSMSKTVQVLENVSRRWIFGVLAALGASYAIGGLIDYLYPQFLSSYVSLVGSFVACVLAFLLSLQAFSRTTMLDRFKDPAEFEKQFKDILTKVGVAKRTLIVFDNLDRCSPDKAVNALSTIKTFLAADSKKDRTNCVFLIPCDDKAVERILKVHNKGEDAAEFLRKFFNCSIRIPPFIATEIEAYVKTLLDQSGLSTLKDAHVASVVSIAFRQNPRQVKQFINVLLAHFLLAQDRENSDPASLLPKGVVTGKLGFLAKILIVRTRFQQIYKLIIRNRVDSHKFTDETWIKGEEAEKAQFLAFAKATEGCDAKDIMPFHYLRQSSEEVEVPSAKALVSFLLDGKEGPFTEGVTDFTDTQLTSLERIVKEELHQQGGNYLILRNIIVTYFAVPRDGKKSVSADFMASVLGLLSERNRTLLALLPPQLVFEVLLADCQSPRRGLVADVFIDLLGNPPEEFHQEMRSEALVQIVGCHEWLTQPQVDKFKRVLVSSYATTEGLSALSRKSPDALARFLDEEIFRKHISSFSQEDIESQAIKDKAEMLVGDLLQFVGPKAVCEASEKYATLLETEQAVAYRDQRQVLLEQIATFAETFESMATENAEIKKGFELLTKVLTTGLESGLPPTQKKSYIHPHFVTYISARGRDDIQVASAVRDFITSVSEDKDLEYVLDRFSVAERNLFFKTYDETLQSRVAANASFLGLLVNHAPPAFVAQSIHNAIEADPASGKKLIDDLGSQIKELPVDGRILLEKATKVDVTQKRLLYDAFNSIRLEKQDVLTKVQKAEWDTCLANKLAEEMVSNDPARVECGSAIFQNSSYLRADQKRRAIESVVGSLSTIEYQPDNQKQLLAVTLPVFSDLGQSEKESLVEFVVHKVILKGHDFTTGMRILKDLQEQHSYVVPERFLVDIKSAAEVERDVRAQGEFYNLLIDLLEEEEAESTVAELVTAHARTMLAEAQGNADLVKDRKGSFGQNVRWLIVHLDEKIGPSEGRFEEALTLLDNAIEQHPEVADLFHMKGLAYFHRRRYQEAVEWYEKAVAIDPGYLDTWGDMITCLLGSERKKQALQKRQKAVKAGISEDALREALEKHSKKHDIDVAELWPPTEQK